MAGMDVRCPVQEAPLSFAAVWVGDCMVGKDVTVRVEISV